MKMTNRKGFTLVELVVVVAIIAILAVIAVPRFVNITESSRVAAMESNFNVLRTAITMYAADHGGSLDDLTTSDLTELADYVSDVASGADVLLHFQNKPNGAVYEWDGSVLTATLSDLEGDYEGRAGNFSAGTYVLTFTP